MKGTLPQRVRLGVFEVDLRAGELRQGEGAALVLSDQPLQILRILIEADGEMVTRDEIRQRLWPDDTVVEFDSSINNAIKKLRRALVDSADEPHYIGTIAKRGYRLLVPVERIGTEEHAAAELNQTAGPSTRAKALDRDDTVERDDRVELDDAVEVDKSRSVGHPSVGQIIAEPRRRSRWKWLAVGAVIVCAVAVGAVFYWRAHRAPKLAERDTIVVADFDNKTGDPVFDDTLKQALTIQLEQSPFLNVLPDEKVADTLKLMNRPVSARITREVGLEVCLRNNSQAVLEGTISAIDNRYIIGLKAVACQTGDTLASSGAEAENRNHVLQSLSTVADQLREKLGESLASVQKYSQPLEQVTTSSLEALQAYTRGTKIAQEKGGDAGLPYYKRAIELDPSFAIAYADLGSSSGAAYDSAARVEYLTKAYELRNRVSLRERFNIQSTYYVGVTGELEKGIATYAEWIQYYPNDVVPHQSLAHDYNLLGQYDKGAAEARRAIQLQPGVENYLNLVLSYMGMNRLGEAKRTLDEAERRNIDGYLLRQQRYILAFLQGDTASMTEQDAWAMGKPLIESLQYTLQSSVEAYHGRFARARELMHLAEIGAKRTGAAELVEVMNIIHGPGEAEVGDSQIALSSVAAALPANADGSGVVEPPAALTLALAGEEKKARALADKIDKVLPRDTIAQSYTLPTIRAAIELASNQPLRAIELLQTVTPYEFAYVDLPPNALYPGYLRGVAYLRAGQGQEAAAEFQKVIDHPGITLLHLQGALAHLQLGRARAMMGDKAAALKSYQDFLTLWKDADPDIPIYKQAKAEYAKLQWSRG